MLMEIPMKNFATISLICFSILFNISTLSAQQILDIEIKNKCIYSGTVMDDELYAFSTDVQTMDNIVKKILELGGELKRNFYIVQTNVENISAVVYENKRYLLWSQDFLENANRIENLDQSLMKLDII